MTRTTTIYLAIIVAQSIGYLTGRVSTSMPVLGASLSAVFFVAAISWYWVAIRREKS